MTARMATGARSRYRGTPVLFGVVTQLAMGVLAGFARAALIVPLHVPLDPNEGWNAYHAVAAVTLGNPYPPAGGFMINNYPPLSFYILGVLGSWAGDNVVAGRLVSLASFAGTCVCIAFALRCMKASWIAAVLAALLFGSTLLLTSDYVGMNDPQLLGHLFQLAALVLLLRYQRNSLSVIASASLFVAGGFVKHNLFALPLATVGWLVAVDRRNSFRFFAALLTLSLIGFLTVQVFLGVDLLRELSSPRILSIALFASNLCTWLPLAALPLCGLLWVLVRHPRDEAVWFVSLYTAISIISGAILLGGAGVDVNAMFDADIALALCAGLAVSRSLLATPMSRLAVQVFAMCCVVPFAIIALRSPDWYQPSFWFHPMREETALARHDIAFLRSRAGAAMCEDLTFCYWADKQASVDIFNLDQQFETGARDPKSFSQLIKSRYFRAVELDETVPFPFPKSVESALRRNYRVDHRDDEGIFFVPR